MFGLPRSLLTATICLPFFAAIVSSHTVITYPGWRGDNLHTNGSISGDNGTYVPDGTHGLGVGDNNTYPYGMQWMYPCTLSPPPLPSKSPLTSMSIRRRHAHVKQPHQMACRRRRRRSTTRLVPRPLIGAHVHQPRRRNSTPELLAANADGLWHHGPEQHRIHWQHLHAAGAATGQLHGGGWKQCDHSDH